MPGVDAASGRIVDELAVRADAFQHAFALGFIVVVDDRVDHLVGHLGVVVGFGRVAAAEKRALDTSTIGTAEARSARVEA